MSLIRSNHRSECLDSQRLGSQSAYCGLLNEGSFAPKQRDQWSIDLNALRYPECGNQENAISLFTPCVRM